MLHNGDKCIGNYVARPSLILHRNRPFIDPKPSFAVRAKDAVFLGMLGTYSAAIGGWASKRKPSYPFATTSSQIFRYVPTPPI